MGSLVALVEDLNMIEHAFHEHLARQIADKLKRRRIVIWYDERGEFVDFIEELSVGAVTEKPIHPIRVGELDATLARLHDAVITLRFALEARVARDNPDPLLVYLPGEGRPSKFSMLMEMEKAGECIGDSPAWSLRKQARVCLARHYTDGKIDELLKGESLCYADVVGMSLLPARVGDAEHAKRVFHRPLWAGRGLSGRSAAASGQAVRCGGPRPPSRAPVR